MRLLKGVSWLGVANVLVKPIWLLFMTAVCPRLLGVEEYGEMTAALALSAIAISFADLGMTQYSVREVAREPRLASRFFSNFVVLRGGLLVVSLCGGLGVAVLLGYEEAAFWSVVFAGLYWITHNLAVYGYSYLQAFGKLTHEAVLTVAERGVVVLGGLLLLVLMQSAAGTLAGMAGGMALVMIVTLAWVARHFAPLRLRLISLSFVKRSVRRMAPLGVAGLLTVLYLRTDAVMVEAFLGQAAVGQYGQAFRLLEALSLLPAIVAQRALFPRLSASHHQGDDAGFVDLLRKGLVGLLLASIVIAATVGLLAPWLVRLLVGDASFDAAGEVLRVLCWTFPFTCAKDLLYVAFIATNEHRLPIIGLGLAVLLNVGLNMGAIPLFGITGAAVMTVLSEVFIVAVFAYRARAFFATTPSSTK